MFVLMSKYTCTCDSDLTQTYFCLYILHKTTVIFLNTLREADFIHLLFFQDYVTLNLFNTTKCTNNANCMLDFLEQSQIYFIMEILNFIILFDRMEQRVLGLIPQKYWIIDSKWILSCGTKLSTLTSSYLFIHKASLCQKKLFWVKIGKLDGVSKT